MTQPAPANRLVGMLAHIGNFCYRRRWWVLTVWLLVMVTGGIAFGPLFNSLSLNKPAQGMESNIARQVLTNEGDQYDRIIAVVNDVDPGSPATMAAITHAESDISRFAGIKSVAPPLVSKDHTAVDVTVTLAKVDKTATKNAVTLTTNRLHALTGQIPGSTVVIGGDEPQSTQTNNVSAQDTARAEILGLPITLVVLVFVFGGLLAALLPVVAAVGAIAGSFTVVAVFSMFFTLDSTLLSVVSLLGLGLSIDYGLLLVARYRDELAAGRDPQTAATRTWATAGRTILFSGLTVIGALTGLLAFGVPRLQTLGAAGISATLVAMLSSLTFTAAMLGMWGKRIRPSKRAIARAQLGEAATERGFFARLARVVQRKPVVAVVLCGAVLLGLAAPALGATSKLPQVASLPRSVMESARAADLLQAKFGIDAQPPVEVLARTSPAALDAYAAQWRNDPAVSTVEPAVAQGTNLSSVTIDVHGDSQNAAAQALVGRLRADRPAGVESWVLGDAAVLVDLDQKVSAGIPLALIIMLAAMVVLLFLMTGSVLVPIKAILTNVLSLGATLGVLVGMFQDGWLSGILHTTVVGGLSPYTALTVVAFAFGFSMDYEVFLLTRIKEHVDSGMTTNTAVRQGLQRSGRIITSAAMLMMIVFAAFGLGNLAEVQELGIGLFVAVLIDATLVRCVLVPATMTMLGRWNWWAPRALRPIHEKFGLREGELPPAERRELAAQTSR